MSTTSTKPKAPRWRQRQALSVDFMKEPEQDRIERFTLIKDFKAISTSNPLVSGKFDEEENEESFSEEPEIRDKLESDLLDLDLFDLVQAKKFFSQNDAENGKPTPAGEGLLNVHTFVSRFSGMCGERTTNHQLRFLFMKIDCNSDGAVSWHEFLTYVTSRSTSLTKPLADERKQLQLVRQPLQLELPRSAMHKEAATHLMYVPICSAYATASLDGSVRIWSRELAHIHTLEVGEKQPVIHAICALPTMHKLALTTDDRQLIIFELLNHANATRWALHGKLRLKELPVSLAAWNADGIDGAHDWLAIGNEDGGVDLFDTRVLVRATKGMKCAEAPLEATIRSSKTLASSSLARLPIHRDWVTQLDYHVTLRALISASHDGEIRLTSLSPLRSETSGLADPASSVHWQSLSTFKAHPKGVHRVVQVNAGAKKFLASCGHERTASIWNLETEELERELYGHRAIVNDLSFDRARLILFSLSVDGEVRIWDLTNPSASTLLLQTLTPESHAADRVSAISFNERSNCLVTADKKLGLWFYRTRYDPVEVHAARAIAPKGHSNPLVGVLYSEHFYLIVSGDVAGLICVWDVGTGAQLFRFEHSCSKLTAMQFDHSGRRLLTGSSDGSVRLWNYSSGELLKTIPCDCGMLAETGQVALAADAKQPDSAESLAPAPAETIGSTRSLRRSFASDVNGRRAAGVDCPLKAASRDIEAVLHIEQGVVNFYVTVGWSRSVFLLPTSDSERQVQRLDGHQDDILCLAFCPPNLLCTGAYDGTILVWNIVSGALRFRLKPPAEKSAARFHRMSLTRGWMFSNAVESLTFLNTSCNLMRACILVSVSADGAIRFWDALEAKLMLTIADACELGETLKHVSAEETNTFLFTGDSAGCIKVWDISEVVDLSVQRRPVSLAHFKLLFSWRAHVRAVVKIEFLKGVEGLVSASADCTVRLWTLAGEQIGVFGQPEPWALSLSSSWLDAKPARLLQSAPQPATNGRVTVHDVQSDDKTAITRSKLEKILPALASDETHIGNAMGQDDAEVKPLDFKTELSSKVRKESRNHSNGLAEAAAKALQPPVWRLDRMEPISLSLATDRLAMDRAQSAAHIAERKKLLAFAQVHTHAASRVGPLRSSASLPKYVHGGGKWVVGSSTRYKPASSSSQRSQSPWDYK